MPYSPYMLHNRCSEKRGSECVNDWAVWTSRCDGVSGALISPERCSRLQLQSGSIEKARNGHCVFPLQLIHLHKKSRKRSMKGFSKHQRALWVREVRESGAPLSITDQTWDETKMGGLKNRALTKDGGFVEYLVDKEAGSIWSWQLSTWQFWFSCRPTTHIFLRTFGLSRFTHRN